MEQWEQEFEWVQLRHRLKERFHRDTLPDLNAVLFLIGIQELGFVKPAFTKEEKQDLMHIAVCRLLSDDGYYEFIGRDADGWPHWRAIRLLNTKGLEDQEQFIITKIISYFKTEADGL
ncbi:MAG: hypothetical protein IPN33_24380 [Saprospiraceae bacterium]|nr:hypothetical protein [Saprospiraceae bacterium]